MRRPTSSTFGWPRGRALRRDLEYTFDTIEQHFPDYEHSPVRAGEVLRGLEPRPDLGLAAEPGGGRPQSQDRLEPDAHAQHEAEGRVRALARKIAE